MTVELRAAIPQFTVVDVVRTAERYRDQLGFEIVGYWREPPVFAIVRRGEVQILFNRTAPGTPPRSGRAGLVIAAGEPIEPRPEGETR